MKNSKAVQLVAFGIRLERVRRDLETYLESAQQQVLFSEWGVTDACRGNIQQIGDVFHEVARDLVPFAPEDALGLHGSSLSPLGKCIVGWMAEGAVRDGASTQVVALIPKLNSLWGILLEVGKGSATEKRTEDAHQLLSRMAEYFLCASSDAPTPETPEKVAA